MLTENTTLKELLDQGFTIRKSRIRLKKTSEHPEHPYTVNVEKSELKGTICNGNYSEAELALESFQERLDKLANLKRLKKP